jgi:hypothetical protein
MRLLLVAMLLLACKKESSQGSAVPPSDPSGASTVGAAKATAPVEPAAPTAIGWVDLDPTKPLAPMLAEQAAAAIKAGKKPHVYLHADWCEPCVAIEKTKGEPKMAAAFAGTHIITIDIDRVDAKALAEVGMSGGVIPVFYRLDASGKPTGAKIDGGAWGDNIPDNMAPPLTAFFAQ